ncbi:L-fucose isomerase [Yeguia hominis]|uniref:FucIase n=1 Tax=Yeguia hominis TaxID=2763662 RepID=A0A926HRV2_9FIRM|nr:L-fucose isomerase [Yeguia hominis]
MNKNNFARFGEFPKIGIRPVIDPRRAVYYAIYEQTMKMACQAADLISSSICYPDGTPVECVINPVCISNVTEAQECTHFFSNNCVGGILTVACGWCYPFETLEFDSQIPQAIWGLNSTERPGAVYLAATKSSGNLYGLPLFSIYGKDVQLDASEPIPLDVQEKILRFARCVLTVGLIRNRTYLSLGTMSMGIASSIVDSDFLRHYLGMRTSYVDMSEMERRIQKKIYDPDEFQRAKKWVKKHLQIGKDFNPSTAQKSAAEKEADWDESIQMALIMKDMMNGNPRLSKLGYEEEARGYGAICSGFQGQRAWTDFHVNADFMEAILNSGFDWDGQRAPFLVSTENDCMNAIAMLWGYCTTYCPQIFCDIRTYWNPESIKKATGKDVSALIPTGVIHLLNSGSAALEGCGACKDAAGNGAIKPFWETSPEEVNACLQATSWYPGMLNQFFGGGWSSGFSTKSKMPVTMSRLNIVHGIGPVLQIAEGYTVVLPEEIDRILLNRTDPTWPSTWFEPICNSISPEFTDTYSVMNAWGSNHSVLSYGHIGDLLITLSSMLRIPVSMHNIPSNRIFRPALWDAYGAGSEKAADLLICERLGALYK